MNDKLSDPWADVREHLRKHDEYGYPDHWVEFDAREIRPVLTDADALLTIATTANQADWDLVMEFWATEFPPHNEGLRIFRELRDALAALPKHLKEEA